MHQFLSRRRSPARPNLGARRFLRASILAFGATGFFSDGLSAQTIDDTALGLAPENAAFFSSSLNMRASFTEFAEGTMVQRLMKVPFVERLKAELLAQWENPQDDFKQAKMILESPTVVDILNLFQDMASTEVFVYGGDNWCDVLEEMVTLQSDMTNLVNQGGDEDEVLDYIRGLDPADFENFRIPTTVIGFKLTDTDIARDQLDALEGVIRLGVGNIEEAKPIISKLKRDDFANGQSLSLTLDTSMIPEPDLSGEQQEIFEKMMELLDGRSISLAVGLKDDLLLITIDENAELLEQVGSNTSSLLDTETIQYLKANASDDLRSVGYISKRFRASQWSANFDNYFERLSSQFRSALATGIDDEAELKEWQDEIETDAQWLDSRLSGYSPDFGDLVSWSQAIDAGTEGYTIDWTENMAMKNASPLSILEHTGANALMAVGFQQKEVSGLSEIAEYVLARAPVHLRRFIELAEEDEEDLEKAMLALDRGWPMLEEIYEIARDKISPALAENQTAFALSAGWTTQEITPDLPPSAEPLPLPEMAWVFKLSDREQFIEGCGEIYGVLDEVVDLVRELNPNSVPPAYTVPRPDEEALVSGTRYFYAQLSNQVPLEGFEPQLLVGDEAIVLGYSLRQVDEMLEAQPNSLMPAWLENTSPVAAISYVNFAGIATMIRPWAVYGFSIAGVDMNSPLADDPGPVPTPNDLLQIWDTLTELGQVHGSTVIDQEGATVTRWQWTSAE